jgi:hypothetical protein
MGVIQMVVGTIVFIIAIVVLMQPLLTIIDATKPIMDTASNTTMYGTDSTGNVVEVGKANAGGDLTTFLFAAVGLFATIGFIVWLVMRAPLMQDSYGLDERQGGNF